MFTFSPSEYTTYLKKLKEIIFKITGVKGFEPLNIDTKNQCLTWFGYTPFKRITGFEPVKSNLED